MASLDFNNVTDGTLNGTGYFDKAVHTLRLHIQDALANNELTQEGAGIVYTGVLPGIFEQAVAFEVQDVKIKLDKLPSVLK